jgi:hypothetical protein
MALDVRPAGTFGWVAANHAFDYRADFHDDARFLGHCPTGFQCLNPLAAMDRGAMAGWRGQYYCQSFQAIVIPCRLASSDSLIWSSDSPFRSR